MKTEQKKPVVIEQDGERFKGRFFRKLTEAEAEAWGVRVGYAATTMRAVWKLANGYSVKIDPVTFTDDEAKKYAKNLKLSELQEEAMALGIELESDMSKLEIAKLILSEKAES